MGDVTKRDGGKSSIILGLNTAATGDRIKTIQDMYQFLIHATAITLDGNTTTEENNVLAGGFTQPPDELSGIFAEGDMNLKLSKGTGMLPLINTTFGDRNPVSEQMPVKTCVPSGVHLFKNVVSGENLAGAADKRIQSNMASIPQAINLRFTPESAALIDTNTPGTINVVYAVGNTETTQTRSFASAGNGLTTAQNWELPAHARVKRVYTTGFSGGTFSIDAIIGVVSSHDLTTATATVANSLSTYPQSFVLVLRPLNSPTLTAPGTPATVTVSYTVAGSTATRTVRKSFADGVKTLPQTLQLPVNATVTGVAFAGWSAGDMDIEAVCPLFDGTYFSNTEKIQVFAVKNQTISGTGAITIADTLRAYSEALQLTVTPSQNATAASGEDPTLTIEYEIEGVSHSGTLTFAEATPTVAQTFDLPADAVITRITRTHWSAGAVDITVAIAANRVLGTGDAYPGRLTFTLSQANPNGKVRCDGLRHVGLTGADVLRAADTVTIDATGTTFTTAKYFYELFKLSLLDAAGVPFVLGNFGMTSTPGGYETKIKMTNEPLFEYTGELEVGGVPRVAEQIQVVEAELTNESAVEWLLRCQARRVDRRRTIEGGWDYKYVPTHKLYDDSDGTGYPKTDAYGVSVPSNPFPGQPLEFAPAIGGALEVDGEAIEYDAAPITINHGYARGTGKQGSLIQPQVESDGYRQITCTITAKYVEGTDDEDKVLRWEQLHLDEARVHIRIYQFRWDANGRTIAFIWDIYSGKIRNYVRVEATGAGTIPVTIEVQAGLDPNLPSQPDIGVTLINDDNAANYTWA